VSGFQAMLRPRISKNPSQAGSYRLFYTLKPLFPRDPLNAYQNVCEKLATLLEFIFIPAPDFSISTTDDFWDPSAAGQSFYLRSGIRNTGEIAAFDSLWTLQCCTPCFWALSQIFSKFRGGIRCKAGMNYRLPALDCL